MSQSITGLDAAGKTSTLYRLKYEEIVTTIPTIGNDFGTDMIITWIIVRV